MVSVMVPPIGTVVAGVNTRTGLTEAPATPPEVIEVNTVIAPASTFMIEQRRQMIEMLHLIFDFIFLSFDLGFCYTSHTFL
jgi:hypothetical protein